MAFASRESKISFYTENLCSLADDCLRFAYCVMLNREAALNVVHYAFKKLAEDIERVGEVNDYSGLVFQATWQSIKPHKSTQNEDISDISPVFAGLNRDERAVLFLSDVFGLPFEEVSKVLSLDHKALREILIKVRKVLTAASISF